MGTEGVVADDPRARPHLRLLLHPDRLRLHARALLLARRLPEQAQFTYLLSNPLGDKSDYFGTASRDRRPQRVITSEFVWYVQVGALVVGHMAALAMGHDKALAVYKNMRRATQSQYWMLALMVSFTVLGLALLSAANQ